MSDIENDEDENEGLFDAIRDDIQRAHTRVRKATYLEYKQDAAENLYPLMLSILEAVDERVSAVEGALGGILEDEDILHAPLAQAIFGLTNIGDALCSALGDLAVDDVAKQRAKELIDAWRAAAAAVRQGVTEALVDEDDDEEAEGEATDESEEK